MVEELEQFAQRVNNRSTRGANLEVMLSVHTTTQCASTAQPVCGGLVRICGLACTLRLNAHSLMSDGLCMCASRAHAGLAHDQYHKT